MQTENNRTRPRLQRIKPERVLGGVCAGIAYWLGWPVWVLRAIWLGLVLILGTGVLAYLIAWIVIPATDELPPNYNERTY